MAMNMIVTISAQPAATLAALEDREWSADVVAKLIAARRFVSAALTDLGCQVVPSQCNFVLVDTGVDADDLYERLLRRGIVVRSGSIWGYTTHLRISMGTDEENRRLIAALTAELAG